MLNGACDNGWCDAKNGSGRYHVSVIVIGMAGRHLPSHSHLA